MRIAIAGGGPVGAFTGMTLARRGHDVTLIDRDPGPVPGSAWQRTGVMQFQHPHGFRPPVRQALAEELPDVYQALLVAGAEVRQVPGLPAHAAGLTCRRSLFERTLRYAARREPKLRWITGHVDRVVVDRGTARGVLVDGAVVDADAVIVATGRASRLGDELRGPVEGGPCGFAYVSRMYRPRPGHDGCPLPLPMWPMGPGYYSLVMPQDAATHSLLVCYPVHAGEFADLRTGTGFDHAARMIPNLAPWCDPDRFEPITDALVGGNLTNTFRRQGPALGVPPARGLLFLGDAVATLNPLAGRYLALAFSQVRCLLAVLDEPAQDLVDASSALDVWAEQHIRPWFEDHVYWDRTLLRRFAGDDIDMSAPIPSDVICAAAAVDPSLAPVVGQYLGMHAGPDVLRPVERRVRELLGQGWRPTPVGPPAEQLTADLIAR